AEIDAAVADLDKYVELLETRRQLHIDQTFSALLENWPRAPLGLFFSILNGDRGVNYPKAEEITQAGIPFINAGDVTERRVSLSQAKFVSEEKYESMGGAKLRQGDIDRKSTRLNSSHVSISYAVFCLKKKKQQHST